LESLSHEEFIKLVRKHMETAKEAEESAKKAEV
jgi:hypothetical protein